MPRALLFVALAACSTSSPADSGTATVSGTIGGTAFAPKDAIFDIAPDWSYAQIVLSSTPDICLDLRNKVQRANAHVVLIAIYDATKVTTGNYATSYAVPAPTHRSDFESNVTDAQCHVSYDPPPDGTGNGTITLTSLDFMDTAGTFDITLESSEHVTGTFHPSSCPDLLTRSGTPGCVP